MSGNSVIFGDGGDRVNRVKIGVDYDLSLFGFFIFFKLKKFFVSVYSSYIKFVIFNVFK